MATFWRHTCAGKVGLPTDCTGRWKRMKRKRSDIEGSIAVENTHERQLMTLLQEMVREKGSSGAGAGAGDRPPHGGRVHEEREAVLAGEGGVGEGNSVWGGLRRRRAAGAQRPAGRPDQQIGGETSNRPRRDVRGAQGTSEETCPGTFIWSKREWRS